MLGAMKNVLSYPSFGGVTPREQLAFVREVFGLSKTELARIFRVKRQAVDQWETGVPAERSAQVNRLVELGQFLQRRLVPMRIPEIVRTPGKSLGGKTMLEVLRDQGVEPIYEYVVKLAAYAGA
jgi:transcriptional regulator with XRE-family HTH domain